MGTNLGSSLNVFDTTLPHAYMQRWSFSVQRTLPKAVLLETSYVGNRATRTTVSQQLDALPAEYLSTSPLRDQNTINFVTAQVSNPFHPLLPATGLAGANVARSQLLLHYPQFTSLTMDEPIGFTW